MSRAASKVAVRSGLPLEQLTTDAEGAVTSAESEAPVGSLRSLTAAWEDVQRTRLALDQRGIPSDGMKLIENRLGRQIRRALEMHPIWPWLSQYPGLGGVHTARLIGLIDDPHRFPGRQCETGHHHSAAEVVGEIDEHDGCGIELADGTVCTALIGSVRRGTGTRSLWHYLGLHVVNGKAPRKAKGQRGDWSPVGRTVVLMPGGIADQIVRARVPTYREVYDRTKDRLTRERAERRSESESVVGPLPDVQPVVALDANVETPGGRVEAEDVDVIAGGSGLRPFQIDAIARKVAAKAFVGDLLQAWKRLAPADPGIVLDRPGGGGEAAA